MQNSTIDRVIISIVVIVCFAALLAFQYLPPGVLNTELVYTAF